MSPAPGRQLKHRRIYKACISCRQRKVKCDLGSVDQPNEPPCARCRREHRECQFDVKKSRAGFHPSQDDRPDPLQAGRRTTISPTNHTPFADPSFNNFQNPQHINITDHTNEQPDQSQEEQHATPIADAYTSEDTLNILYRSATCDAEQTGDAFRAAQGGNRIDSTRVDSDRPSGAQSFPNPTKDVWSRLIFIQDGLFSVEEALVYLDFYREYLNPFTPISCAQFLEPEAHADFLTREPILLVTVLMITSRFCPLPGPGALSRRFIIHERLWQFLQQLVTRIFWAEDEPMSPQSSTHLRTIGTCEALLLITEWHPRILHFPPSREGLRILVGGPTEPRKIPVTLDPAAWMEWSWRSDRLTWSLLWTAFALASELDLIRTDPGSRNGARRMNPPDPILSDTDVRSSRLLQLMLVSMTQMSSRTGSPSHLPQTLKNQSTIPQDSVTRLWVDLSLLNRKVWDTLFASRDHVREIIGDSSYIGLLYILAPRLKEWKEAFEQTEVPEPMRVILGIEFDYLRSQTNSIAMQAVAEKKGHQLQATQARNDDFISETIDGSRSVLRAVADVLGPMERLKYIPVRTYYRILTSVIYLIKAIRIVDSPTEAEISCALVEQVGIAMRGSVADDANLGFRWGNMIIDLAQRERKMLARRQRNTTDNDQASLFTSSPGQPATDPVMSPTPNDFPLLFDPQTWLSFPMEMEGLSDPIASGSRFGLSQESLPENYM